MSSTSFLGAHHVLTSSTLTALLPPVLSSIRESTFTSLSLAHSHPPDPPALGASLTRRPLALLEASVATFKRRPPPAQVLQDHCRMSPDYAVRTFTFFFDGGAASRDACVGALELKSLVQRGVGLEQCMTEGVEGAIGGKGWLALERILRCLREYNIPLVVCGGGGVLEVLAKGGIALGVGEVYDVRVCGKGVMVSEKGGSVMEMMEKSQETFQVPRTGVGGRQENGAWQEEKKRASGESREEAELEEEEEVRDEERGEERVVERIEGLLQEVKESPGSSIRGAMLFSPREKKTMDGFRSLMGTSKEAWKYGAIFAMLIDVNGWSSTRNMYAGRIERAKGEIMDVGMGENPFYVTPTSVVEHVLGSYLTRVGERQWKRRVAEYLRKAVKSALGFESFVAGAGATGGWRNSKIEIIACTSEPPRVEEWCGKVMKKLCNEAVELGEMNVESITCERQNRRVRCRCGGENVIVVLNHVGRLTMNTLMEKASQLVGRGCLVEKGLALVEAWAENFVNDRTKSTLLTREMLEVMLLYLVNVFHAGLTKPLDVLACFLTFFSSLDLGKYILTVRGPVRKRDLRLVLPPSPTELLLPASFSPSQLLAEGMLKPQDAVHVWDPTAAHANLAAHISAGGRAELMHALVEGCNIIKAIERGKVLDVEGAIGQLLGNPYGSGGSGTRGCLQNRREASHSARGQAGADSGDQSTSGAGGCGVEDLQTFQVWEATARLIVDGEVSELGLLAFLVSVVEAQGSLLIGEIGQALRDTHAGIEWGTLLKERFGGLKRLLRRAQGIFEVGTDHPLNPRVRVCETAQAVLRSMAK